MHPNAQLKLYRNYWHAVWTEDGSTKRHSLRTKDYEAACRRFDHWKRFPKGDLILDAAELYLAAKHDAVVDSERLENAWKAAGPFFGHLRPAQITKHLCRDYTALRRRLGRGDGTIRRERGLVRAALHYVNKAKYAVFAPPAPLQRWRFRTTSEGDLCNAIAFIKTINTVNAHLYKKRTLDSGHFQEKPKKSVPSGADDLFRSRLESIINMRHEVIVPAGKIDWSYLDDRLRRSFPTRATRRGRAAHQTRSERTAGCAG